MTNSIPTADEIVTALAERLAPGNQMSWDGAIYEARQMIKSKKAEITRLREAIRTFERLRKTGEAFPNSS